MGVATRVYDEVPAGKPNMITTPTGWTSMKVTLKQVECNVGVDTAKTDKGVSTGLDDEVPAGKPNMFTTPTGKTGGKATLIQVECNVGVGSENGVGIGTIDRVWQH